MKTSKLFAFLIIIVSFTSCKKNSNDPEYYMRATIDGNTWSSNDVHFFSIGNTNTVTGKKSGNIYLEVKLEKDVTGTFDIKDGVGRIAYSDGTYTYSNNIAGSISIESNNPDLIQGTFNVTNVASFIEDTLVFTNGSFKYISSF